MKPPVDAPTSRQRRPAGSMPNASSALASFTPPRETNSGRSSTATTASSATSWPGLAARSPALPSRTSPASTAAAALRAGLEEAALREQRVEASSCHRAQCDDAHIGPSAQEYGSTSCPSRGSSQSDTRAGMLVTIGTLSSPSVRDRPQRRRRRRGRGHRHPDRRPRPRRHRLQRPRHRSRSPPTRRTTRAWRSACCSAAASSWWPASRPRRSCSPAIGVVQIVLGGITRYTATPAS